jgi:hypothetical protein
VSATETVTAAQPVANGKKRKAETTPRTKRTATQHVGEDALEGVGESPQPKRRATKNLKVAEEVEDEFAAQESGDGEGKSKKAVSRRNKKATATKKTVAEDDMVEGLVDAGGEGKIALKTSVKKITTSKETKATDEDSNHEEKPKPKPKSKARAKNNTVKILPPLAERTKVTKHRLGAHVSTAGG